MARSVVKLKENWGAIDDIIREKSRVALAEAADTCLSTIEEIWPTNNNMFHTERVEGTVDGYKSGVSAEHDKKHIAHFHDHGTLGSLRRGSRTTPKRPRLRNYSMTRPDGSPTGIAPLRFYGKGRGAGRKALLRSLGI